MMFDRYRLKSALTTIVLILLVAAVLPDLRYAGRRFLRITIGTVQHTARFVDHGLGAIKPDAPEHRRYDDEDARGAEPDQIIRGRRRT